MNDVATILTQIPKYEPGQFNRGWAYSDNLKVYFRATKRYLSSFARPDKHELYVTLDIAAVEVDGKHQRQGLFTELLRELTAYGKDNGFEALFVETLIDEVHPLMIRTGWIRHSQDKCFYYPLY